MSGSNRISFGSAPTVKRGGAKTVVTSTIPVRGLRDLKACRRLRAVLLALEADIELEAKKLMNAVFIPKGCKSKSRPDNFTGIDEDQQANCQLRARNFGQYGINDDVTAEIEAAGLGDLITSIDNYSFNNDVMSPAIMAEIEAALSKIKNVPPNLIVRETRRSLATDAINTLFATKSNDPTYIETVLALVSTPAIRVDYDKSDTDVTADVTRVAKLLDDPRFADLVKKTVVDPSATLSPRKETKPKKKAA